MHEMSYVAGIVNTVLDALETRETEVLRVTVECGGMTGVVPDYLIKYYGTATKDTLLEGSELVVRVVPVSAECEECGSTFSPDRASDYRCPKCGSYRAKILSGREFNVVNMEILPR